MFQLSGFYFSEVPNPIAPKAETLPQKAQDPLRSLRVGNSYAPILNPFSSPYRPL